jgi:AbrB family looped-hinge helix DNA binding protein
MPIVKAYAKGQIVIPKEIRDVLGIKPGKQLSIKLVDDHAEIRPLPSDPVEFLTGIFKDHPKSLAGELLKEREKDDKIDEKNRNSTLWLRP